MTFRADRAELAFQRAHQTLTPRQLEILQHALGVDEYGRGQMYRNHFCAGVADENVCRELVAMGFMETFTRKWLPYYNCIVTETGKAAMLAQSPKPPKLSAAKRRYLEYLRIADATNETFIEYLRRISPRRKASSAQEPQS